MRIRFWGTRGSIATPGPETIHFGGNTSCVELQTDAGATLILDCGTGARALGADLMQRQGSPPRLAILFGHTHWDHIQGFPFFAPVFTPGSRIDVYAPEGGRRSLHGVLAGQMEFTYFPVELDQLPAEIEYHELKEGEYEIAGARVRTQFLNHPAATLGYRIECDGAAVVYMTDQEPFADQLWRSDAPAGRIDSILHAGDRRHAEFMAGADLVIHDAQYTPEEYDAKKNWGHSHFSYIVELAAAAGVRRLALTHHDPAHDDAFVAEMEGRARARAAERNAALDVFCAYEGCVLEVRNGKATEQPSHAQVRAELPARPLLLLVDDNEDLRRLAGDFLKRQGFRVQEAGDGAEALDRLRQTKPDLVVLDLDMPRVSGMEVLSNMRASPGTDGVPVLILTASTDETSIRASFAAGATDYLMKPFSTAQLIARARACLFRAAARRQDGRG
jgi:CheY-like chemotaxis protein/phosphoribosyl 1,2-cyclic phosphodiesterase